MTGRMSGIAVISFAFLVIMLTSPIQEAFAVNKTAPQKTEVKFYAKDGKTGARGAYLGSAALYEGKLTVNITDKRLDKFVKSKMVVRGGMVKEQNYPNGRVAFVGGMKTYAPGTAEHLDAVINSAPELGYIVVRASH